MTDQQRKLLMTVRQCTLMMLGALEDYLELERSVVPKHRRVHDPLIDDPRVQARGAYDANLEKWIFGIDDQNQLSE